MDLEFLHIASLSKDKFKSMVKEKIQKHAFQELMEKKSSRISENSRGKHIEYEEFFMQEYLTETDSELSCDERKWMFKCRTNDIDLKANFRWKHEEHTCISCKKNINETNEHHLLCENLIGKKRIGHIHS